MNSFEVSNLKTDCNPMIDTNVKLIRELKEFVSSVACDSELLDYFRYSPNDIVRSRKLPFEKLVLLIVKLCKKTLSVEIEIFFAESGQAQSCSVSAFVQHAGTCPSNYCLCVAKTFHLLLCLCKRII
jgi:hypothetical protein